MGIEETRLTLFSEADIQKAISDVADAIIADFQIDEINNIALIGLQTRGVQFSKRLAHLLEERTKAKPMLGKIDISMYRDDIGLRKALPAIKETVIPFNVDDCIIILADDVLYTGRTIRAALDAITDYGRPRLIRLAVIVDRGHREFPIQADYIGCECKVGRDKKVKVHLNETDDEELIYEL